MIRPAAALLLTTLTMTLPATAAELVLHAPDDIARLLKPFLPDDASPRKLESLLGEILATEGYFTPSFTFAEDSEALQLTLDPGLRTQISAVDINLEGDIDAARRTELIADWGLPVGAPFRQADWSEAKQNLLARLLAVDYADARLSDSRADVDAATGEAQLQARYETGPRYRFGPLRISGAEQYPPDLIARYNRSIRQGQPYREEDLQTLQTALQATPYFSAVETRLLREEATPMPDGALEAPVRIQVRERAAHRLSFGAGASSNTGLRAETSYHTPNLANLAWQLDSGIRLEERRQTAYTDLFFPPDERQRRNSVGVVAEASDIQGLKTQRYAFGAQTVQQRGIVEQRLSLHWEDERRMPDGSAEVSSRALVPNAMWTWRHVDNLLDPREGSVVQGQIGGGAKAALSDQNFARLHLRFLHYLPIGQRDTLALRGELGYTLADSRQHIPQDYLFRAGGAGSVRGYAYQSLGIREGNAIVGGRYLATASAEWTHWLDNDWGVAAFVDAGDAVDSLADIDLAIGFGLGARWRSPAGPIGVDLAYGQRTGRVQLHFSLAIPF